MDFLFPYSEQKVKPYLKMAVQRINIANNKRTTQVKHQKREIAQLLADHKDEKAKIKAEHIIRDDFTIEGYEVLELLCELVHERVRQITTAKECPADLKEAVCSLIWAAHNVDIEELKEVSSQLTKKFGREFAKRAIENENNEVNVRLCQKLTYRPPSAYLVMKYLEEIAKTYQVAWEPSDSGLDEAALMSDQPFASPSGSSIPMAPASGLVSAYSRPSPSAPTPTPLPATTVAPPVNTQPAAPSQQPIMRIQPQQQPAASQLNTEAYYEQLEREQFLRNQLQQPLTGAEEQQTVIPIAHAEIIPDPTTTTNPSPAAANSEKSRQYPSYDHNSTHTVATPPSPAPVPAPVTSLNSNAADSNDIPADIVNDNDNDSNNNTTLDSLEARLAALNKRSL